MKKLLISLALLSSLNLYASTSVPAVQYVAGTIDVAVGVVCLLAIGSGFPPPLLAGCAVISAMDAAGRFMDPEGAGYIGIDNFIIEILNLTTQNYEYEETSLFLEKWNNRLDEAGELSTDDMFELTQELAQSPQVMFDIFNNLSQEKDSDKLNELLRNIQSEPLN